MAQPGTYLGAAVIFCCAGGLAYLSEKDRVDAVARAEQTGANLARVVEGMMARTFKGADSALLLLRDAYRRADGDFSLAAWSRQPGVRNELTLQFTIVDRQGLIRQSSVGPDAIGIHVGDREHFQAQARGEADALFVSKPVKLRAQDAWGIVLTRRLSAADGSFDGIVAASLDPFELQRFFNSIDLGPQGIVSLVGLDGVIRARGGSGLMHASAFGRSVTSSPAFARLAYTSSGSHWNGPGAVDSVRRLISYRVIEGLPLLAVVGMAEREVFRFAAQNARVYTTLAAMVTLVILIAMVFAAVRHDRLLAATAELRRTNLQFDSALDNMPHGLSMFDRKERLVVCNQRYLEMYGLTPELGRPGTAVETLLRARANIYHDRDERERFVAFHLKNIRSQETSYRIIERPDGRVVAITHQPMQGGGWVAIHADITAERQTEVELAQLAQYDPLTGLTNRAVFQTRVAELMQRLHREGAPFALLLLDLDHFKAVNDSLGHAAGDYLIASVADRLKACAGEHDMIARLGGDEFAVLQTGTGEQRSCAAALAECILRSVAEPYEIEGHRVIVEASVGIAFAPGHGLDVKHVFKHAELALYGAKSEGRNRYRFFERGMEAQAQSRYMLEIELRSAIPRESFELHYQPIVGIDGTTLRGMEALVRWPHPRRGNIEPDAFIPIAEATGLIVPLGAWVLRKACAEAASWPSDIKVAVNLSPVQFRRGDIVQTVKQALRESGLRPERLEVEVTESVLLENDDDNLAILHQLRNLGIGVALDDFGIGYSSLSYLRIFPFDKIKIDRSFVREITTRTDCAAIVSAITGLARSLNMSTTAEGVETAEQLALLRAAGCSQLQGYLFGRPRPAHELLIAGRDIPRWRALSA